MPLPVRQWRLLACPRKLCAALDVLLREALKKSTTIAISMIVLHTRAYLSAIYELEDLLILNLLRFESELREYEDLSIPEVKLTAKDMQRAAMNDNFYKQVIAESPTEYAYHRIIYNRNPGHKSYNEWDIKHF
jgi:non-homologous end joining protein Ku